MTPDLQPAPAPPVATGDGAPPSAPPTPRLARPLRVPARKPVARRPAPKVVPPAPEGPFIDGRAAFDWSRVPGFVAEPARGVERPVLGSEGPAPLAPLGGAVADAVALTLVWRGVEGARGYEVEVAPGPAFTHDVLALTAGAATELSLSGLLPAVGARLFWRVRADLGRGVSRWSLPARFYAGAPRDVEAFQAREALRLDEERRAEARQARAADAERDLVPFYLREDAAVTEASATAVAVLLLGTLFVLVLLVAVGAIGALLA